MNTSDLEILKLKDDPEFMSRYDEIKAELLEETRPSVDYLSSGNFSKSYLTYYGV